jgi:hypothetical protein
VAIIQRVNRGSVSRKEPISRPEDKLVRQIDDLHKLSADFRREFYGETWFQETRDFYNMVLSPVRAPSFRPQINITQLQVLMLSEASDLADAQPRIYITNEKGGRSQAHEKGLNAEWRDGHFNQQLMLASLWSLLSGNGYIQPGFDPMDRNGRGRVWAKMRDPESVYPDPACVDDEEWFYLILTDRLYPDQIHDQFPERGRFVKAQPPSGVKPSGDTFHGLQMPSGPMSTVGNLPQERIGPGDGRVLVRYIYIKDPTVREIKQEELGSKSEVDELVPARFEKMYPNGRLIIEAEGEILFDGDNPHPNKAFPLIRVQGLPAIGSFFAPPPIRISRSIQELAARMLTQVFENAVRLNNGVWFIDEATGLTAEDFGGIPAEIRVINANARYPELKLPRPFPPHMLEYPKFLLQFQKELQGFPPSRQGQQPAGNVGPELFNDAVFQSQSLTRLRAKMMVESVHKLAVQVFQLMAAYYNDSQFPDYTQDFQLVDWKRIGPDGVPQWNIYLDPGSIRPISVAAMRKLVPELRKEGLIDARTALEAIDFPGATEISQNMETEKALEALARLKKNK